MRRFVAVFLAAAITAPAVASGAQITIPTVLVGDPGYANDPATGGLYGGVGYVYRIGTTEVTNDQYVAFLNAKAASDPLGLYNAHANDTPIAEAHLGIIRSGASGSFTYASKPNFGNKPVNFVSWYDAIRFANWMNNGQGDGDTETGAYTLLGGTPTPSNALNIARNPGAVWFLPSENEWYKAAYYQPASQGGDFDNYWDYPTRTNFSPNLASSNSVGDINNPQNAFVDGVFRVGVVNAVGSAFWNNERGMPTTVGSAGPLSNSFYGTADQGGNVSEWNETLSVTPFGTPLRVVRGGDFDFNLSSLEASSRATTNPNSEGLTRGFRLAMIPEPSSLVLIAASLIGLLAWGWRRNR
jgi:sulfatase modifying factor 1